MTDRIDRKLLELKLTLPEAAAPVAAYVPTVAAGGLLHISGPLPFDDGALMTGRLGADRDLYYGYRPAQPCAMMLGPRPEERRVGRDLVSTCIVRVSL